MQGIPCNEISYLVIKPQKLVISTHLFTEIINGLLKYTMKVMLITHRSGDASFGRSGFFSQSACFSACTHNALTLSAAFTKKLLSFLVSLAIKGLNVGSRFFTSASVGLSSYTLNARNCATGGTMFFSFLICRTVLFSS